MMHDRYRSSEGSGLGHRAPKPVFRKKLRSSLLLIGACAAVAFLAGDAASEKRGEFDFSGKFNFTVDSRRGSLFPEFEWIYDNVLFVYPRAEDKTWFRRYQSRKQKPENTRSHPVTVAVDQMCRFVVIYNILHPVTVYVIDRDASARKYGKWVEYGHGHCNVEPPKP